MPALPTTIIHVDMDAFFAAIEQRDRPELRGKPVIVGAPADARGVVSTCSYEARRFGVHSAMPSRTAAKLCPHAIFVPVDGKKYAAVSRQVQAIFERFTPLVEPVSVDEAFLDVTGSLHLFGGALELARQLKSTLRAETGLTGSVGIAPNKFLAKLASDLEKPDGLTVVPREPEAIAAFLAPLPVTRIWGVGKKSAEVLNRAGLQSIGDLQRAGLARLTKLLGEQSGQHAYRLAFGRDERQIVLDSTEKSISHEHTYGEDCADWTAVEDTLIALAQKVGRRLRRKQLVAATAHLKLRWSDFQTITRQMPLPRPTHADQVLIETAQRLLREARQPRPVRLIGFGVSALHAAGQAPPVQPDLFAPEVPSDDRREQLDRALDAIRNQFGEKSIRRARG